MLLGWTFCPGFDLGPCSCDCEFLVVIATSSTDRKRSMCGTFVLCFGFHKCDAVLITYCGMQF